LLRNTQPVRTISERQTGVFGRAEPAEVVS